MEPLTATITETTTDADFKWTSNSLSREDVIIETDGSTITIGDEQKYGSLDITKADIETVSAQGDADFGEIELQVKNVSGSTIITKSGREIANNAVVTTTKFAANSNKVTFSGLPMGKYEVTEIAGNKAYLLNTSWKLTVEMVDNGKAFLKKYIGVVNHIVYLFSSRKLKISFFSLLTSLSSDWIL